MECNRDCFNCVFEDCIIEDADEKEIQDINQRNQKLRKRKSVNKEHQAAYYKKYYEANKERLKKYSRDYYKANIEEMRRKQSIRNHKKRDERNETRLKKNQQESE